MKKLFFRFDFSPKIKKFLTTLHNTQERAILWITRQFLPFLFPRHCPLCDKLLPYGSFIHEECHRELPLIHSPVCMRCGKPVSSHTQEYCYDCRAFPKSFQRGLSLFLYNKKTNEEPEPPKQSKFEKKLKASAQKSREEALKAREELQQLREKLAREKEERERQKEEEKRRKKEERQAKNK